MNGRCGTSPTALWPAARWPLSRCPGPPAGASSRRPSCATARSGEGACQLWIEEPDDIEPVVGFVPPAPSCPTAGCGWLAPRTRSATVPAGPRRRRRPRPDGHLRRGGQQRRPQGRPRAAYPATGGSSASTTVSASTSRTSCAPCCGAGSADPLPDDERDTLRGYAATSPAALGERLCHLLAPDEVAATISRVDRLLRPPRLPRAARRVATPSPGRRSDVLSRGRAQAGRWKVVR